MEGRKMLSKKAAALLAAVMVMMLSLMTVCAQASDVVDTSKRGSITVTAASKDQKDAAGATLRLYKVAGMNENAPYFYYTDAFKEAEGQLDLNAKDSFSSKDAETLYPYAEGTNPMRTATINADGTCVFSDLPVGLYLVTGAGTSSSKTVTINPFLISLPFRDEKGEALTYDATVEPKFGIKVQTQTETNKPTPSTEPSKNSSSTKLPQTGQLWWPVWLLGAAGAVFVCVGLIRKFGAGTENTAKS